MVKAGQWYEIPRKAASGKFNEIPQEVRDLVKLSAMAHKKGHGNFIWTCWQPGGAGSKPKRTQSINSGLMMAMISRDGAEMLDHAFRGLVCVEGHAVPRFRTGHFDLVLKEFFLTPGVADATRMCYVVPPIGNYSTHQSGCDPSLASGVGRASCWDEKWVCRGTRKADDPTGRDKYFAKPTKSGEPVWISKANVTDDSPDWCSFWAGVGPLPAYRAEGDRAQVKGVKKRPSGSASGPAGPEPTAVPAGPGRGRRRGPGLPMPPPPPPPPPPPFSVWPDRPAAPRADPIEATDEEQPTGEDAERTTRHKRFQRHVMLSRSFRTWVTDVTQVASTVWWRKKKRQYGTEV